MDENIGKLTKNGYFSSNSTVCLKYLSCIWKQELVICIYRLQLWKICFHNNSSRFILLSLNMLRKKEKLTSFLVIQQKKETNTTINIAPAMENGIMYTVDTTGNLQVSVQKTWLYGKC